MNELIQQRNRALEMAISLENQYLKANLQLQNAIGIIASLMVEVEGCSYDEAKQMAKEMVLNENC